MQKIKGNIMISTGVSVTIGLAILGFLWTSITKVDSKVDLTTGKESALEANVAAMNANISAIKDNVDWIRKNIQK